MNNRSNQQSAQPFKAVTEKIRSRLAADVLRPIRAFRLSYLPLVMVYFAYGALGIIDVSRDMWIKERLTLNPAELAGIGVWLTLPWTIKMVFGELVDSVPIFGSQRRSYILIGAALTASWANATARRPSRCFVSGELAKRSAKLLFASA